jgi:hypothetical protein
VVSASAKTTSLTCITWLAKVERLRLRRPGAGLWNNERNAIAPVKGFFSLGALVHLLWCSRRPEILARTTSVPQTTFSGKKDCVILRELADAPQAVEA